MKSLNKGFAPTLLLIAIVVVMIGVGCYFTVGSKTKIKTDTETNTQATSTVSLDTNDWKTFSDVNYGFSFSYPNNFTVEASNVGNHDLWFLYSKNVIPPNPSLSKIFVFVYEDYDYIKDVTDKNVICGLRNVNTKFGNGFAREYGCGDAGTTERRFLVPLENNAGLLVSITTDYPEPNTNLEHLKEIPLEIQDRILSSFKFTSQNLLSTQWKTYTNAKYGFEFKYPSKYFVFESEQNNGLTVQLSTNNDPHHEVGDRIYVSTYPNPAQKTVREWMMEDFDFYLTKRIVKETSSEISIDGEPGCPQNITNTFLAGGNIIIATQNMGTIDCAPQNLIKDKNEITSTIRFIP